MKAHFLPVTFILVALLVSSCNGPDGPDGIDGNAYVAVVSSDGTLQSGWLFGSMPSVAYSNTYYLTDPGNYAFAFVSRYYSAGYYYTRTWSGTYSITVYLGERGGKGKPFWQKGDAGQDGADKYYKLDCTYSGLQGDSENHFWKKSNTNAPDSLVEGKLYTQDFADDGYVVHIQSHFNNGSVHEIEKAH